ncbi:RNase adapter RapZ [Sorangium cellulosum]|uniref:Nucleotide-binding protein n=1 Tax=Sorangium cellulosum So0157-2 TaxID=1254432 RepID=S4Y2T2_SORCE|nr:RNase adapter RapZ [Sorangium cellulosum]AGP39104.1 nucleotide-binding protein [Sorangium cellulosum So0157-2]
MSGAPDPLPPVQPPSDGATARVVVVTGLSGAGKSTALHALEDLGFFCVDNLPTSLVRPAVEACEAGGINRIGLGIDVRVGSFLAGATAALDSIRVGRDVVILFLDASDETLLRRFSETRRPHPLTTGGSGAIAMLDGVLLERERLASLRARATIELDTTRLSTHDLRRAVLERLRPAKVDLPRMSTRFISFGYKYGIPLDADLLFDVRFLDNPYFVHGLRELTGNDEPVREYILKNADALEFISKTEQLLSFCMPRYADEGKSYLTIGIGCTGGRHRSVVLTNVLSDSLRRKTGLPITVVHRDVARASSSIVPSGAGEGMTGTPSVDFRRLQPGTAAAESRPGSDKSVTGGDR